MKPAVICLVAASWTGLLHTLLAFTSNNNNVSGFFNYGR